MTKKLRLLASPLLVAAFLTVAVPARANIYKMATTGNDANPGTDALPWLTPNHANLTCADSISVAAGTYQNMTMTVNPSNCALRAFVPIHCAVFATCKINGTQTQGAALFFASNWGIDGWSISTPPGSYNYGSCIQATGAVHDIFIFNNVVANCQADGIAIANRPDHVYIFANVAYDAAKGNANAFSGISVYEPGNWDNTPGTHIYLAQNFCWHNIDPAYTDYGDTDGECIIVDTPSGLQSNIVNGQHEIPPYDHQVVAENNLAFWNGAGGIDLGGTGNTGKAKIIFRYNTASDNFRSPSQHTLICGEIEGVGYDPGRPENRDNNLYVYMNIARVGPGPHSCGVEATPYFFGNVGSDSRAYANVGFSDTGTLVGYMGLHNSFYPGPTNLFADPMFNNPVEPPAPDCENHGYKSVIECMVGMGVVHSYTPTNPLLLATGAGYHLPDSSTGYDPEFPSDALCGNPNIPTGLLTMRCDPDPAVKHTVSTAAKK